MNAFSWAFLAALAAATLTRLWLARRQIAHVRAHRDAVPPDFAATIPLAAHQKAADYTVAKTRLHVVDTLLDAAVLVALTLGGVLQLLIDLWAGTLPMEGLWHGAVVIVTVFVLRGALDIPLALYRTFVLEERFGFNKMTLALFITDLAKGLLVTVLLGVPLLLAVLWLMQTAGPFWWLYVWVLAVVYSVFLQLIIPTFVMPLFNKFSPLQDPSLAERVGHLLQRCGFRSKGLFVMDGSKRSAHGNAYFTGFGASKRIVFFDTLLSRLAPAEVEAVLAHELGHFKLHHVIKGMLLGWTTMLAMLFALGLLAEEAWFYTGLGVQTQTFALGLLLFLLVASEFTFFLKPLTSLYSRKHEFEADAYAAAHASAAELVRALVKLYQDNAATLTPDPVHSAFYDSHPPAALRIARLQAGA